MRDWSNGLTRGYYNIQASQFDTRMPLHINDIDITPEMSVLNSQGHVVERPLSEFTMLSYTVHAIKIVALAREAVDLQYPLHKALASEDSNEATKTHGPLNKKYEDLLLGLPSYFRTGSTVGIAAIATMDLESPAPLAAIPVHRWMLHQQLWSLLLRLHRFNLSNQVGRESCQLLAQDIISTQAHIQSRCTICGSLSTSDAQLFSAAAVLVIDLLFSPKQNDEDLSSVDLRRLMVRDKVREAIELLQSEDSVISSQSEDDFHGNHTRIATQRSIRTLETLLKLEEEKVGDRDANHALRTFLNYLEEAISKPEGNIPSDVRLFNVLDANRDVVNTGAATTITGNGYSTQSPSANGVVPPLTTTMDNTLQDHNVLPFLYDDPNGSYWHYLNFSSFVDEGGPFVSMEDWQAPIE